MRFSKVVRLPIYEGELTKEKLEQIRAEFPGQPRNMDYRKEFIKGRGASTKDPTWNRKKHIHTCCKSKVPWRHKAKCPKLNDPEEGNELWKALGN